MTVMDKKRYIAPAAEAVQVGTSKMIMASPLQSVNVDLSEAPGNQAVAESKSWGGSIWDDEE